MNFAVRPKLSILLSDNPLVTCIRKGIQEGVFLYREGEQLWGKGDPEPAIRISDNALVHTLDDARAKKLWPRPAPLKVQLSAAPVAIRPGGSTTVTAVGGGRSGSIQLLVRRTQALPCKLIPDGTGRITFAGIEHELPGGGDRQPGAEAGGERAGQRGGVRRSSLLAFQS